VMAAVTAMSTPAVSLLARSPLSLLCSTSSVSRLPLTVSSSWSTSSSSVSVVCLRAPASTDRAVSLLWSTTWSRVFWASLWICTTLSMPSPASSRTRFRACSTLCSPSH
ncbi:hypothetical protein LPJ73_007367, partial [Coemansia sp. RSA 2703]